MSSKPYDATMRTLFHEHPGDLAELAGFPGGKAQPLDTDISTTTSQVDCLLDLGDPSLPLLHLEAQASHNPGLIEREFEHNVDIWRRYRRPVRTAIIYLSPDAYRSSHTGVYIIADAMGEIHVFHYLRVKIWEIPEEKLLSRVGTMPLAVLAAKSQEDLSQMFDEMDRRLAGQPLEVVESVAAAYLLGGMLWPLDLMRELIDRRHPTMRESVTYQAILDEGRAEGVAKGEASLRRALLSVGRRWGEPAAAQRQAIDQAHLPALEAMMDALYQVNSWDELLRRRAQ